MSECTASTNLPLINHLINDRLLDACQRDVASTPRHLTWAVDKPVPVVLLYSIVHRIKVWAVGRPQLRCDKVCQKTGAKDVLPNTDYTHTPHHHNCFIALFRDHLGEPVPEENFWTLWCKGRLTEAETLTIQLGATPSELTSAHVHHHPFSTGRMPFLQPN